MATTPQTVIDTTNVLNNYIEMKEKQIGELESDVAKLKQVKRMLLEKSTVELFNTQKDSHIG